MNLYGLIGKKLGHSFSKNYFEQKFNQLGLNAQFLNFELQDINEFPALFEKHPQLKGISVTNPFKQAVMDFVDHLDESALRVGAVNSIKVDKHHQQRKLTGFNTDIDGFEHSLKRFLKPHHRSALVFGSGGASLAVQFVLKKLDIDFKVVSRKSGKGDFIYEEILQNDLKEFPLLINTTPLGVNNLVHDCPQIDYDSITKNHLAFDLNYNPEVSTFLRKAQQQGASVCNGREMLELQAEKSWQIWQ
jgi:shikimate dehydrogenase